MSNSRSPRSTSSDAPIPDPRSPIPALSWPADRIGDALIALARRAGLDPRPVDLPFAPTLSVEQQGAWIGACARQLGIEADQIDARYGDVEDLLRSARYLIVPLIDADAQVRLKPDPTGEGAGATREDPTVENSSWDPPSGGFVEVRPKPDPTGVGAGAHAAKTEPSRYLVILRPGVLIAPDLSTRRVSSSVLRRAVCGDLERAPAAKADALLDRIGVAPARRAHARQVVLAQQLADARISGWTLRLPPERPLIALARHARLGRRVATLAAAHGSYLFLWVLSWWLIGAAVLDGRLDRGWLLAWLLLLLTLVPIRMAAMWLQGKIAVRVGALLKERLLSGAFRLDPETVLKEGAGQLLGRVLEADAVESLALNGGFAAIVAALELVAAAIVLAMGYSGWMMVALLGWCLVAALVGWRYFQRAAAWTGIRLAMTNALVERMVGHRTRLAQEAPGRWHDVEDQELDRYVESSVRRDRAEAVLLALIPQGWLVVGLMAVGPAFVSGRIAPTALAAGLGGTLLATRAFHKLSAAFWQIIDARIAWRQIEPLLAAAETPVVYGSPAFSVATTTDRHGSIPVLDAQGLVYRYPSREEPVLRRCSVRVSAHDRVLLQGSSGGGKSTLVSVLTGIRTPQAGLLLAGGLDQPTLGVDGWRRRIVAAPQFHQNHVITGTLAFNLLMGRRGPFTSEDERDAMEICREMGLGPLLEKMPGGLQQMVGETGWQLSQGERSRVFMARALLQRADLVVLDESFAALDPETLEQTVACVLKRAPALLVIAHE